MLFWAPIEDDVLRFTNLSGLQTKGSAWKDVEVEEMRAYIGLLILSGVFQAQDEDLTELWDDYWGRPIFRATMTQRRFQDISSNLRFDDRQTRERGRERDKFGAIRVIYEKWNNNLSRMFNPNLNVVVDEQMVPFRGKCPFRQYIPSKPSKYGLKIWALCDCESSYIWNTQVYTGKAPNTKPEVNQGKRVVLDLVQNLRGRCVTADNFFSSHDLVRELAKKQLTFTGTVRKNKLFLPPKLVDQKKNAVYHSQFLFDNTYKISLVSYVPKKGRMVLLMSSNHCSASISKNENKKPQMILDYNHTKGGVDTADQMLAKYSVQRKTERWPKAVAYYMINTSGLNGYIIFKTLFPDVHQGAAKRRLYLRDLGEQLVKPWINQRETNPVGQNALRLMRSMQDNPNPSSSTAGAKTKHGTKIIKSERDSTPNSAGKSRCKFCEYSSSATRYKVKCSKCSNTVCPIHTAPVTCLNCA